MASKDRKILVGIDEVGRGPLAGPITVGAVAVWSHHDMADFFAGIRDSKKLSEKKREEWAKKIKKHPHVQWVCVSKSAQMIDMHGIARAAREAVASCLKKLGCSPSDTIVMLDGGLYAPHDFTQTTVIKGDEKIPVISAASIVAKVTRDRTMKRFDVAFPEYQFATHKGYGTRAHIAVIRKNGLSRIHRVSFCRNFV